MINMFNITHHKALSDLLVASLLIFAGFISSCTQEEGCTDPKALNYNPNAKESNGDCRYPAAEPNTNGTLKFNLSQLFNGNILDTAAVYTLNNGQRFRLATLRYYISKITLVKSDSSEVVIPESYLLVKPSATEYIAGEAEPGTYVKLKFYLGLDSATNSGGIMPVDRPSGHPLALQNPSMFWTWSTGYIFMKMEGLSDTLPSGALTQNFSWHLGENALRRTVEIPLNFTLVTGQTTSVALKAELNDVFKHIDFKTDRMTHTMDNRSLANAIMDYAALMFSKQ